MTYRSAEAERSLSTTRKLHNWNQIAVWWSKCQTIEWPPTIALSCPSQQARCIMASAMNRACKLPMLSRAAGGLVVIFTEACPAHLLLYQWKAWVAEWFDLWFRRSIPLRFTLAEENQMWKGSKRSLQCMLNLLNSEPREWSNWRKQTLRSMWVRFLKQNALMHFGRVW